MIHSLYIAPLLFVLSFLLVKIIITVAHKKQLLDHPNNRSSHSVPTPRGGGLGFVVVISVFLIGLVVLRIIHLNIGMGLIIPSCALALVGLLDDIYHLSSKLRFSLQAICTLFATLLILDADNSTLVLFWGAIALLSLLWSVNLFNFMDGIDGLTATESIFLFCALPILFFFADIQSPWGWISLLTACPVLAFLCFNWSPAKIFMGDVGSTYLGLICGLYFLIALSDGISIWSGLILPGVFLCDATWTLLTRLVTGQRWYTAHRSHAYQKLAIQFSSHVKVVMAILFINILWLLPLAVLANHYPNAGAGLLIVAYFPLLVICIKTRAGLPEGRSLITSDSPKPRRPE